jgi:hypothetical protein
LHDNTTPTGTGPEFEHYNAAERAVVDGHVADVATNPHAVTAAQAGAEPANANIQAHVAGPVAGNPHAVTFTEAVTADAGTDITAAEAETLTDGSNADLLHAHAPSPGADHGGLAGLADDDHLQYLNETRHDALPADNPHSVTAAQTGAEPANANIQAHIADVLTNPHAVTAAQAGAEPANPNIQAHIIDLANPHAVTAAQAGAAPIAHVGAGGVAEHALFTVGLDGFVPDPVTATGLFLRDDGTWATPTGGGTVQLVWRFDTSIVMAAPASGRWRMNNATPASVTTLALNDTDRDGVDTSTILDNLAVGDALLIQQSNDATKYLMCDVVLSTDQTGWFEIDVTIADSGVIFDNNQDCLFIIVKGGGGGGVPGDQAHVQARRTTAFAIPTATFTDVPFDVTDEENDTAVLDHDLATNTDNIIIGSDKGPTEIHVSAIIDAPDDAGDHYRIEARLRTDDAVVIPGSEKQVWVVNDASLNGDDIGALLDYTVQVDLAGIGFITLQLQKISLDGTGVVNMLPGSTFQAVRLSGQVGAAGATGAPGAGSTILVEDEGTPLATAADTLNFTGAGVTASGAGTTKTINIPGGGGGGPAETAKATRTTDQAIANATPTVIDFNSEEFDTDTMHDNVTDNSRMTINTAGKWLFGFNGRWENDSSGNRTIRLLKNGTTLVGQHMQNPGTPEWYQSVTFPIQDAIVTDFFEIEVEQDSGGGLDMEAAGTPPPTFWAHRQS